MATRLPKLHRGTLVRLTRDVRTRGGVTFRAGLTMVVQSTGGEYYLAVTVRGMRHYLRMLKKDYPRDFVFHAPPPGGEDAADTTEE